MSYFLGFYILFGFCLMILAALVIIAIHYAVLAGYYAVVIVVAVRKWSRGEPGVRTVQPPAGTQPPG